jgi:hypothetical protein
LTEVPEPLLIRDKPAFPVVLLILQGNFHLSDCPKLQLHQAEGGWPARFTGVCGLDGHSQAPMDENMASQETGGSKPALMAEHDG